MYQTVIVEDDPMVAMLNRTYIERDGRFQVSGDFRDGRSALEWITVHPTDLAVLDVYMPEFTGLELLRQLRSREVQVDAVMVTAATDTKVVDQFLKLGVVDYLVKPFTLQRFQQALEKFCQFRQAMSSQGNVSQADLDKLLAVPEGESAIPKGLQERTMERIRQCLLGASARGLTSEEVAGRTGLSAVTARRYLNHMLEMGEVSSRVNYDTGGRPSMMYHLLSVL